MELGKLEATLGHIDKGQTILNHTPCERGEDRCLEPREGEGHGWHQMNPDRMCPTCAAYWHLGCAVNLLNGHKRMIQIIEAESDRKAHEVAEALEAKLPEGVVVGEEERATIKAIIIELALEETVVGAALPTDPMNFARNILHGRAGGYSTEIKSARYER